MSAIFGVYHLDGRPVEPWLLEDMSEILKHRGTDNKGNWIHGNVGLGHRMHWVTPESLSEKLPRVEWPVAITCDARLDNRAELISALGRGPHLADTVSDSELILLSYRKWGQGCLDHLMGDFVFVIWDEKKRAMFAARDPLGVKHFYYCYNPHKFLAIASEIKALKSLPYIPIELDEEKVGEYLVFNFDNKENTFFKNIKRLPAGTCMWLDPQGVTHRRYWEPNPTKEIRFANPAEYVDAFKDQFERAVSARLRSAFPIGSELSGGLDSSAIVCFASRELSRLGRPPIHSFSAVFPTIREIDRRIDEFDFMKSAIGESGCKAHFVNCDDMNPLKHMSQISWHSDQPVGSPNFYMQREMFERARNEGVRVMLSGIDGDSTVSHGYEDLEEFARRGWWYRLIKESLLLKRRMPAKGHSFKNLAWTLGVRNIVPEPLLGAWHLLRYQKLTPRMANEFDSPQWRVLNKQFRESSSLDERIGELRRSGQPDSGLSVLQRWNKLTSGLYASSLENYENVSQGFGMEVRFPFFDRRLIEFCVSLPAGERLFNGWTRSIFRRAMTGIVPSSIQWRTTKANLGAGLRLNILKFGRGEINDVIDVNPRILEKYLDIEKLREIVRVHENDPLRSHFEILTLNRIIYLSKWMRNMSLNGPQQAANC